MKKLLIVSLILLNCAFSANAQITIAAAKSQAIGSEVTVAGIVTNSTELGEVLRYLQDETAGIVAYGAEVSSLLPGDSIVISGTLKDYSGLLEIEPISSVTVVSSGHKLPDPIILTPNQYSNAYESMIIKTNNAILSAEGKFSSGKNYNFSANMEDGQIRITSENSPFVGSVIPQDTVNITGILSEYDGQFQVLVRLKDDIRSIRSVSFASAPIESNLSTTGFTLSWTTDSASTTEAFIGNTLNFELPVIKETGESTEHSFDVTGGSASTLYYVKPFSVRKEDTAYAGTLVFVTQSASSGDMKAYFTKSVDLSVSTGTNANSVNNAIADTLINYINRATSSIDMAIYNIDTYESSKIITALNNAHARGVDVRVVYDFNTAHTGIAGLNASIGKIASPESNYNKNIGIMHNKFVIFDVDSINNSFVWTGSTNFTSDQMEKDANNVIIIQDKSLALAYTLEFNEMFGSESTTPNSAQSKFGASKSDNTPHNFKIGGVDVELYFSPSDNTHTQILNTINSAQIEINAATMTFTKSDAATSIVNKFDEGVVAKVILDDPTTYDQVDILAGGLKENFRISGEAGMLHHKYVIIDPTDAANAKVLTGCHNWTAAAQERNDENTLIIHNQTIANEYLQEFTERFNNGEYIYPACNPDSAEITDEILYITIDILANDFPTENYTLTKIADAKNGLSHLTGDNKIYYQPNTDFISGSDTVWYKVKSVDYPTFSSTTWVKINVNKTGENSLKPLQAVALTVYPNPSSGNISVILPETEKGGFQYIVFNALGKEILIGEISSNEKVAPLKLDALNEGIYHLRLVSDEGNIYQNKLVIRK